MGLKPSVTLGKQGLTETAVRELDFALSRLELIKVRVNTEDREARTALLAMVVERTEAVLCGSVGSTASFYRPAKEPKIKL